jgi:putative transport protein
VPGFLFGRLVLKMNPAILLGALIGAMTRTPALGVVQDAAKSPVPPLGYAGTYAFANIFLTMAGAAIMLT